MERANKLKAMRKSGSWRLSWVGKPPVEAPAPVKSAPRNPAPEKPTPTQKQESAPSPSPTKPKKPTMHLYEGSDSEDEDGDACGIEEIREEKVAKMNERLTFAAMLKKDRVDDILTEYQRSGNLPANNRKRPLSCAIDVYVHMTAGMLAPSHEEFVPLQVMKKFPYVHANKDDMKIVCPNFFDQGQMYNRVWDLFYVYRPGGHQNLNPIILVLAKQFKQFIDAINDALGTKLQIPTGEQGAAFSLAFCKPGLPRARYLGRSTSQDTAEALKQNVPPSYMKPLGEEDNQKPSESDITDFQAKLDLIQAAQKGHKSSRNKNRAVDRKAWGESLKRLQHYLGLDASLPVNDVIFLAIDVEAYECDQNIITEIGIATLNTRTLRGTPPGYNGHCWSDLINARHFRIRDHLSYRNHKYVRGCPDNFDFGDSEFLQLRDATQMISSCFKNPFFDLDDLGPGSPDPPQPPIVLVGHNLHADVEYVRKLGFDITTAPGVIDQADTDKLWQYITNDTQSRKLTSVLGKCGQLAWNPHNAGNDAVYTLQAMLGLAVMSFQGIVLLKEEVTIACPKFEELTMGSRNAVGNGGGEAPPNRQSVTSWIHGMTQEWRPPSTRSLSSTAPPKDFWTDPNPAHSDSTSPYRVKAPSPVSYHTTQPRAQAPHQRLISDPFREGHYFPTQDSFGLITPIESAESRPRGFQAPTTVVAAVRPRPFSPAVPLGRARSSRSQVTPTRGQASRHDHLVGNRLGHAATDSLLQSSWTMVDPDQNQEDDRSAKIRELTKQLEELQIGKPKFHYSPKQLA